MLTAVVVVAACVAGVVMTGASSDPQGTTYYAIFDNAFGIVEGGDLRIGGVRAGETTNFGVAQGEPVKARVEFTITEPGFDSLREDARCEVRQQSLIGEYYVDCQPGTSDRELPPGGTIPVEQTASVIPVDLVNNVLREPYRERLRLIIAELGTGLAGRPEDLSETLRRAHPGLRETISTLRILRQQTDVLRNFVADSDEVIDDLARNRADVVRFVREAGETAEISATRREELAEQFDRLPTFLAELDPTMVELAEVADAQIPLLADLRRSSDELNRFFTELGPFSDATLTSLGPLGEASVTGNAAIRESDEEIRELRRVAAGAGEVGEPLRQFLQSLDNRRRAITTDTRASRTDPPRFDRESLDHPSNRGLAARGYTGYEALINFAFWQSLTINSFDGVSHFLRILGVVDEGEFQEGNGCSPLATGHFADEDAEDREELRARLERCNSYLGPNQPGIVTATGRVPGDGARPPQPFGSAEPDFTEREPTGAESEASAQADREAEQERAAAAAKGQESEVDTETLEPQGELPEDVRNLLDGMGSSQSRNGGEARGQALDRTRERAERALRRERRRGNLEGRTGGGSGGGGDQAQLLDFLLGP